MRIKLTIELIPQSTWGKNCRSMLTTNQWNYLKKQIVSAADNVCQICKGEDITLDCHEEWGYNYHKRIQYLKSLKAICKLCHYAKHFGRTKVVESQEVFNLTYSHILRVNKMTPAQFVDYMIDIETEQGIRTQVNWTVNINKVNDYLPSYLQYDGNQKRR